jgi:hypothetical protein
MSDENTPTPQEPSIPQEETENTEVVAQETSGSQEDLFTSRFAALSKREKKIIEERAKFKEVEGKFKELEAIKEGKDPLKALEYHGYSLDDVIAHALGEDNKPEVDPVEQMKQEFEAYKKSQEDKVEEERKAREEQNQNSIDEAINNHKQAIDSHISQNADKYELINNQSEQELVWEVTEAYFNEHGEVLSVEDASNKVEKYLEDQVRDMLKLNKFNNLKSEQMQDNILGKKESPTLTSDHTPSTPVSTRTLSYEESLKEAAKFLKWK